MTEETYENYKKVVVSQDNIEDMISKFLVEGNKVKVEKKGKRSRTKSKMYYDSQDYVLKTYYNDPCNPKKET